MFPDPGCDVMSSSKKTTLLQHPANTNATANQALFILKAWQGPIVGTVFFTFELWIV